MGETRVGAVERDHDRTLVRERDRGGTGPAPEVEHPLAPQITEQAQLAFGGVVAVHDLIIARCYSPAANFSTIWRASSSWYCTGGDFMK